MPNVFAEVAKKCRIVTPPCILSFPHLYVPQPPLMGDVTNADGTKRLTYNCMAIFKPNQMSAEDLVLWNDVKRLVNMASNEEFQKPIKELPPQIHRPFQKGDTKPKLKLTSDDLFCNPSSKFKPQVVLGDGKTKVEHEDTALIYAGCWVRLSINAFGWKHKTKEGVVVKQGVSLGLFNVMFIKHGDRLDNRVTAEQDFAEYASATAAASAATDDPNDI